MRRRRPARRLQHDSGAYALLSLDQSSTAASIIQLEDLHGRLRPLGSVEDALPPALERRLAAAVGFGLEALDRRRQQGEAPFLELQQQQVHLAAAQPRVAGEG